MRYVVVYVWGGLRTFWGGWVPLEKWPRGWVVFPAFASVTICTFVPVPVLDNEINKSSSIDDFDPLGGYLQPHLPRCKGGGSWAEQARGAPKIESNRLPIMHAHHRHHHRISIHQHSSHHRHHHRHHDCHHHCHISHGCDIMHLCGSGLATTHPRVPGAFPSSSWSRLSAQVGSCGAGGQSTL